MLNQATNLLRLSTVRQPVGSEPTGDALFVKRKLTPDAQQKKLMSDSPEFVGCALRLDPDKAASILKTPGIEDRLGRWHVVASQPEMKMRLLLDDFRYRQRAELFYGEQAPGAGT